MNPSWTLSSAHGWTTFAGTVRGRFTLDDGRLALLAELKLAGDYWHRAPLPGDEGAQDLVPDFEVRLPQFVLDEEALRGFLATLDSWLAWFDARQAEPGEIAVELATEVDQRLAICLGHDDSPLIASASTGHFACTIHCCSERLRDVAITFATDQSCVRNFRDDLEKTLRAN